MILSQKQQAQKSTAEAMYNTNKRRISCDIQELEKFIGFCGTNYKYSFEDLILVYAQNPHATALATYDEWNTKLNRSVKKDQRAIVRLNGNETSGYTANLFDCKQTYSRNQTALPYWKYDDTYKATIIGDLAAEESEIIDAVSSISKQQFKQDDVLDIVSGDTNNHTFDPANLQNIYTSFILCAVCKRLDIPYKFELQTKINCDKIITLDNISVIGTLATGQASQILRKIERSIYNANKLQRNGQRHELRGSIGQPHSRAEQASKLQLEHENTGNGGLGFKRERLSETADEQQWRNADQNISGRYDPDIRFKFGNRGLADDIHGTELQQSLSDIIPSISERISPRAMEPASEERRFEPVSLTNDGGNEREGTLIDSTNRPLHSQRNIVKSDVGNISSNDWTVADGGRRRADGIRNRLGQPISGRPDLDTGEWAVGRISTAGPTEQKIDLIAATDTSPKQGAVSFFVPEKLNFVLESNTVPSSFAPKSRFANNIDAIILLKKIEEENRFANASEQKDLNKYAGWGGLPQAFDSQNSSWQNEYKQLVQLLNPDEYEAARASVNNAHYTSGEIIRAMYKSLDGFGFDGGNILEPGMGIGNFFGALPAKMTSSKLYGVEIDSVSGRIARQLYQNADIQIAGFEESCTPDNFFDAAISNVPFGSYKIADKKYDKNNLFIHDYFFLKSLDKVRSGGIIAFITSKGTLDKERTSVRKMIAERAELLGAIRLPNTAFKDTANTNVTSDIIFLKKREALSYDVPSWVNTGFDQNGIRLNNYYLENPQMLLGTMAYDNSMYGNEKLTALHPFENSNLELLLDEAVSKLPKLVYEKQEFTSEEKENTVSVIPADPNVKNYSFAFVDDIPFYRENSIMKQVNIKGKKLERLKGICEINRSLVNVLTLQQHGCSDYELQEAQTQLGKKYDSFINANGHLNLPANKNVFRKDVNAALLLTLEVSDGKGNYKKADIFTKRTVKSPQPLSRVETARDALTLSLREVGRVDFQYMQSLYDKPTDEVIAELQGEIFLNPDNLNNEDKYSGYESFDKYLSGDVRQKLAAAQAQVLLGNTCFEQNVAALERSLPPWIEAGEIDVRLGSTWVDCEYYNRFIYETLDISKFFRNSDRGGIFVSYNKFNSNYTVHHKSIERSPDIDTIFGTKRMNALSIIEESLNMKNVVIRDPVHCVTKSGNDSIRYVYNHKETIVARQKQEELREQFRRWIFADSERRIALTQKYNLNFNSIAHRKYDGSGLILPGINPNIELRPHQLNAVARIAGGNNSLLAHVVGAGKTFTMIAGAKEQLRLGIANKVAFVVPNHMITQFADDIFTLYPSSNILVASEHDFETNHRRQFLSRIALSDIEMVVMGHTQFEKISMSPEYTERFLREQIDDITGSIAETKHKEENKFTVKQLETEKKRLETQLKKSLDTSKKDNMIIFEQLGINSLFVDEAHSFKNCSINSKMRNVAGISSSNAKKSSDMLMKCRYLTKTNGIITFSTGTPISNSMAETYIMQRYLQNDLLKEKGINHFDEWASTFGETKTSLELAPEGGGYRLRTRFANFHNLSELMQLFRDVADIQTSDMLNLPTPKIHGGKPAVVVCTPSPELEEFMCEAIGRVERIRNREVTPEQDNMLKFTGDAKRAGLDMRLLDRTAQPFEDGKIAKCAELVYKHYKESDDFLGTQLVFCDTSTPNGKVGFNAYDELKNILVNHHGIPSEDIAYIHSAKNSDQKKSLFEKVRNGQIRILLASTSKCGAGTNIQDKLIALHHLDCPFRPSDIEQREGRILRQGNKNDEVSIYRYVTEKSFDAYLWNIVETKQRFISQIMSSKTDIRHCEDVDEAVLGYAEAQAIASGNPLIKEKIEVETEVSRLRLLETQHRNQLFKLQDDVQTTYPKEISGLQRHISLLEQDISSLLLQPSQDEFLITLGNNTQFTEREQAGKALAALAQSTPLGCDKAIGKYLGFTVSIRSENYFSDKKLVLTGAAEYTCEFNPHSGLGNITRIENLAKGIERKSQAAKLSLEDTYKSLHTAQTSMNKPFELSENLKLAVERLTELEQLLDLTNKDDDVVEIEVENLTEEVESDYDLEP